MSNKSNWIYIRINKDCSNGLGGNWKAGTVQVTLQKETVEKLVEEKAVEVLANVDEFFIENQNGATVFSPATLGERIMQETSIKTLRGSDEMFYYTNGVYIPHGKEIVKEKCLSHLQEFYSTHRAKETIGYIQARTYTNPQEVDPEWLNFGNGLLNPTTMEFKDHTPEHFSTTRLPVIYDPEATCEKWLTLLNEKVDKKTVSVLQEFFGYCFIPRQPFEKALLLYGPKRTFKSTALSILEHILGKDNLTAYSVQELSPKENKYTVGYLYGKLANIMPDLDSQALKETGGFMTYVGGDLKTAEKKHGHHFSFYPTAKLIFSCNNIPTSTNKTTAFYRRWIILEFKTQTPEDKVDSKIKEQLKEEASGILNWVLEGLQRLKTNNKFSYWLNESEVRDLYERGSDSVSSYINIRIDIEDDDGVIQKRVVYRDYVEYCKEFGLKKESPVWFGRNFLAITGCGTTKVEGIPAYKGVSYKGVKPSASTTLHNY